ncbi:AmmeMemoRadiSam system protein B [Candidatus Peregrinibacteria bacterium]|jgi:gamma-polyglutamate biosynthesis protein CapA|nr:AmmeMemoRadiSam system protein B [Candidatus Peregrinibacteria bacterium]MBT4148714.1 AmmeMemoRadiSam system protein B [Candidatus Peregrinibacteria bacterium]MBT4456287.1 AmmeMemoRadiSam system protein B [Candidatus Peregrinibacteria bacterium]
MKNKLTYFIGAIAFVGMLVFYNPSDLMKASIERALEDLDGDEVSLLVEEDLEDLYKADLGEKIPEEVAYFTSYMSQKKFFESAYLKAAERGYTGGEFSDDVSAGILPHHLIFSDVIAGYFDRLAGTQDVDTFVVIGPNHFDRGKESIAISEYGYTTPYGKVEVNSSLASRLIDAGVGGWDIAAFDEEHSISSLVPYIKRDFPDAKIVAISLKLRQTDEQLEELAAVLEEELGSGDFVLASIDFSHYMWQPVADFHDELARTVIETFDFDQIDELEIDSPPTLKTVMEYASLVGAQKVEIVDHTNSAEKVNGRDFVEKTTSHFYIGFLDGSPSEERAVTVAAFGDMMLGRYVRTLMDQEENLERSFDLIRGDEDRFFYGSDVFFANLEGPIEGDGYPSGTSVIFGFNEDVAPLLGGFGFDVLSIANNHILNQGWDGYESTIPALHESGIGACGHPTFANPNAVVYKKFGDKTVGFVCFDDVAHRLDRDDAAELIKLVDLKSDYAVVSIHWGYEYKHTPNEQKQRVLGQMFVDAGADAVIGHHPHVVQTFEIYNGAPIFYSLGNFIFDQYWSYDTEEQLGVGLVFEDDGVSRFYLFPMHSERSQPYLMDKDEKNRFYDRFIGWGGYSDEMAAMIRASMVEIQP